MSKIFDHLDFKKAVMEKIAVIGIAKALMNAGKVMVRNPMKSLGVAGTSYEMGSAARGMGQASVNARKGFSQMKPGSTVTM